MAEITYRNPDSGSIYTSSGQHIKSLEEYQSGVVSGKYSGSPLDYKQAPWYSTINKLKGSLEAKFGKPADASDITSINTDDAIANLNKDKDKLDRLSQPDIKTFADGSSINTKTGEVINKPGYKPEDKPAEKPTKTNNLTFEEAHELFGNDFSGVKKNADGTFTPSSSAYERIGITGMEDTEDVQLEGDLQELDNTLTTLSNNLLNYNVANDPAYQTEAQSITQQYDKMRSEMSNINNSRKRALETLGYRTGSTQYAGAIQLGIVGEEIKQGDERILEITRQESAAKSAARKAIETQNYTKFAQQMDAIDKLRDNKSEELKRYNEKLAEANKLIQEQAKQKLETLKYQESLKTNDIKEFEYAQEKGFDGSYLDYLTVKENLKKIMPDMPSSYQEWTLAGGKQGTGKTYAEYLQKEGSKGPTSYQEWSLAGGKEGTGKTYAEFIAKDKGLDTSTLTKVMTIANSFDGEQAVKSYQISAEAIDSIKSAGDTPTDDISRVYVFAKVMDPNSVVREGEYKTVQDYSTALLERMGLKAKRVFDNSGFLTEEARNFMLLTLENRLKSSEKAYKNIYDEYGRRINKLTGSDDGVDYLPDYSKAFKPKIEYETEVRKMIDTKKISEEEVNNAIDYWESEGLDWDYEDVYNLHKQDFSQVDGDTNSAVGMRTDRSNNPTAFTVDIAKQAGLKEGVDYQVGDPFPNNPNLKTAKLLGDPVKQTIKVIDNISFYTDSGKQRWTHTAMSKEKWNKLSYSEKKNIVKKMYQAEGNEGQLNKYFT